MCIILGEQILLRDRAKLLGVKEDLFRNISRINRLYYNDILPNARAKEMVSTGKNNDDYAHIFGVQINKKKIITERDV